MKSISDRDKVLLHLSHQKENMGKNTAPYDVCQRGISESIDLSYHRVGETLDELIERGLVKQEARPVASLRRERKVYLPTSKGYRRAEEELRESLGRKEVTVRTEDGEEKVKLEDIDEYTDEKHPMLSGLKLMSEDGVVDLTERIGKKEDVFVGRGEEMEKLKEALDEVKEQGSSIIFLSGDAGIGKTRLVHEFKDHAVSQGFEFLAGSGHYGSSEPYLPLREAFKEYIERESEGVEEEEFDSMALVGPADSKRVEVDDKEMFDAERTADWNKSTERVRDIASKKPLLVFLDDLQWSDQSTLQLLHYMVTELSDSPVLFIGAYLPQDVTSDHPMVEFKRRMGREDLFDEMELDPLDSEETRAMIEGLVGREGVPDRFVKMVHDTAEGNPLFIREIVEQMMEDSIVKPKEGEYPESAEPVEMPDLIDDIIQRRIDRLSLETERLLHRAAVIGEEVPFELLTNVVNIDELDLLDHLDMMEEIGLMYEDQSSENFLFSHGLIQQAVFDDLSRMKRKKIHQLVAEGMEELYKRKGELKDYYSDIAYHYERGEKYGKAVENYYNAGQEAEEVYAHEDAIQMFNRALGCLEESDEKSVDITRLTILEELGDAYNILGKYDQAVEILQEGKELAEQDEEKARSMSKMAKVFKERGESEKTLEYCEKGLELTDEADIERCRLLNYKGWALMLQAEHGKAIDVFEEERDIADRIGKKEEKAQAMHDLGSAYIREGEYETAKEYITKAIDIRKEINEKKGLSVSYNNLGVLYRNKGEFDKALENHQKSLDISKEIGDIHGVALSLNNLGIIYDDKGELDKALEYQERGLDIKEMVGAKRGVAASLNNIGIIYGTKGDLDKALECQKRSLELKEKIEEDKRGTAATLNNIGDIYKAKGDLDKALEYQKRSLEINEEIGDQQSISISLNSMGEVHRERGELDKALEAHNRALEMGREIGHKQAVIDSLFGLTETRIKKGAVEKAKEDAEKAAQIAEDLGSKAEKVMSHIVLGMAYKEQEQWTSAEEELKKAIEDLKERKDKQKLSKAYYQFGSMWAAKGEKDRAAEYLEKALSMFKDMGMELWEERCKSVLDE